MVQYIDASANFYPYPDCNHQGYVFFVGRRKYWQSGLLPKVYFNIRYNNFLIVVFRDGCLFRHSLNLPRYSLI